MTFLEVVFNAAVYLLVTGGSLAIVMYCGTHEPPKNL